MTEKSLAIQLLEEYSAIKDAGLPHVAITTFLIRATMRIEHLRERETQLLAALKSAVKIADAARDEWDATPNGMKAGKILIALSGYCPGYRPDTDAIHAAIKAAEPKEDTAS